MEKGCKKRNGINTCVTAAEGIGLGAVGVGLPDIPLFLGILLKGIYETALSFGYDYKQEREQILILRMISASLARNEMKRQENELVNETIRLMEREELAYDIDEEIRKASKTLSEELLLSKFIQGFFIIGIAGGMKNPLIYRNVLTYTREKYKKRYILQNEKGE